MTDAGTHSSWKAGSRSSPLSMRSASRTKSSSWTLLLSMPDRPGFNSSTSGWGSYVNCRGSRAQDTRLDYRSRTRRRRRQHILRWYGVSRDSVCTCVPDCTSYLQLTQFPDDTLERPFALIEQKVQELKAYVGKWFQFQSLWDLEAESVYARLGDSLALWQQLLTEIKKARSTFDTSETQRTFGGVCVVDYEQVQTRVNAKYDAWQREILSRFGVKLGNAMKEMHASILKARNDLEHHSIEGIVSGGPRRF
jgi:hypothetical protein